MWTGRQQAAGPALAGLSFSLSILSEHACVYVYCISVGVRLSECTVIARLITRHFPPWSSAELRLRRAFAPSRASARDRVSLCIMQTGNLCPLSSLCGHCSACHSLLSAHATRRTPQPHRQRVEEARRKNNWLALSCDMWQSFKKALVLQSRLDGCECNKSKAIIHRCFFFFWDIVGVYLYSNTERKRQTDILEIAWLKRALLKDRILIFNALQLYQLNRISSEGITCMVKNVRCYKCLAEIDRISQEMCVERPENTASPWHYHCVFIRPQLHNAASCCKIFQITKQVIAQRPSFILLFLLCFSLPKYLHFLMRITLKPQLLQHKQKHRESQYVLGQTHTKKLYSCGFFFPF